ncbi:MAG: hypothetical protein PHU64_02210 [Candidatus Omnitrophica bacterium]|nr:hypothetical protein [Candidatus Omnitrophota bacterium]MDD5429889.1 hypothetical protein [Candidatus Omnitrophota bacterium]
MRIISLGKFIWVFIFLSIFETNVLGKPINFPAPWQAKLVDENVKDNKSSVSGIFKYTSKFSKDRIVDFYHRYFSREGFSEQNTNEIETLTFVRDQDERRVTFLPSPDGQTNYIISFYNINPEIKKKSRRDNYMQLDTELFPGRIAKVEKLNFMPLYSGLKGQLEYINWEHATPPVITVGYLSQSNYSDVTRFYLQNMPDFSWRLSERNDSEGVYLIDQWVEMVAPYTNFCPNCEGKLPAQVPPLHLKGSKLIFTRKQQKCEIAIYTFDDIIEKAKGTVYEHDIDIVLGSYGTTVVSVVYSY